MRRFKLNCSMPKDMESDVATTAESGTRIETVTASIYFIDHALATQQTAIQTTPKKTTSKIGNTSNVKLNSWKTGPSKANV